MRVDQGNPNTEVIYLTSGCCENAHGDERYFRQFGLKFGAWNPSTGELLHAPMDGPLPEGCEFYPLTPFEAQYITDGDSFNTPEGPGMMAYSVLYRGVKYLAPQVEIPFAAEWNDAEYTRDEALAAANKMAAGARKVIESVGGKVLVQADDTGDRHTVMALVPFDYAFGGSFAHYKETLNAAFSRRCPQGDQKMDDDFDAIPQDQRDGFPLGVSEVSYKTLGEVNAFLAGLDYAGDGDVTHGDFFVRDGFYVVRVKVGNF